MNNFDRILKEIEKEANEIAPSLGLAPNSLVKSIMEIVDLVDQDRVRPLHGINKKIERKIQGMPPIEPTRGDG